MARTLSKTDASTAKSTTPKTGTDAQMQRMRNTVTSLMKDGLTRGVIGDMYRNAMKMQGSGSSGRVSDKDIKQAPKAYKRPPQKKAMGGAAKKKMYGGTAKKGMK